MLRPAWSNDGKSNDLTEPHKFENQKSKIEYQLSSIGNPLTKITNFEKPTFIMMSMNNKNICLVVAFLVLGFLGNAQADLSVKEPWCWNSPLEMQFRIKAKKFENKQCKDVVKEDCNDKTNPTRRQMVRTHCSLKCKKLLEQEDCKCTDSTGSFLFEENPIKCTWMIAKKNCHKSPIWKTCPRTCNQCPDSPSLAPSSSAHPSTQPSAKPSARPSTQPSVSAAPTVSIQPSFSAAPTSQKWMQLGDDITGEVSGEYSGWTVSMSDDLLYVAVGGIYSENGNGEVRVFEYFNGAWYQIGSLSTSLENYNMTGLSLSLTSKYLAIGMPHHNAGNGIDSGHVMVLVLASRITQASTIRSQKGSTIWSQIFGFSQTFGFSGKGAFDKFGSSVSFSRSGSVLAIGAPGATGHSLSVEVYRQKKIWGGFTLGKSSNIDGVAGKVLAQGQNASEGQIVLESGAGVWEGSRFSGEYPDGQNVWEISEGQNEWEFSGFSGEDPDDEAGKLLALSDNDGLLTVAYGTNSGVNYAIYGGDKIGWEVKDTLSFPPFSVALSGDGKILAIGTMSDNGNGQKSCYVSVFYYVEGMSSLVQVGGIPLGEDCWDDSSYSVSLSDDGKTLAIGTRSNDGNGNDSGYVRVYAYEDKTGGSFFGSGTWSQIGDDIVSEHDNDRFGWSVSLSHSGRSVAVGAPYSDVHGDSSGLTRVFDLYNHWKY